MEPEATILERLQELRKWQVEQQERLLKQQQEQRDLLSHEQDRMYEALGLSVQNIVSNDSHPLETEPSLAVDRSDSPIERREIISAETSSRNDDPEPEIVEDESTMDEDVADMKTTEERTKNELIVPPLRLTADTYLNYESSADIFSPRSEIPMDREAALDSPSFTRTPEKFFSPVDDDDERLVMDGVKPLAADKPANRFIDLDDLPVPSPKKDFKTLLEERLRDCEASEDRARSEKNTDVRVKRPFLRKGEGLARYTPGNDKNIPKRRTGGQRRASVSAITPSASNSRKSNPSKLRETPKSSRNREIYGKTGSVTAAGQAKTCPRNIASSKYKKPIKSVSAATNKKTSLNKQRVEPPIDMNASSDIETKNRRELEEMRIFELLEEKAEHSSFCSNSSTVMALFRQSTPLKNRGGSGASKNRENCETSEREPSDRCLEEIVRTTRSNMITATSSPITKNHEAAIRKDRVISNRDTGARVNENINTLNNSNRVANYRTIKQTPVQSNNNNGSNKNNDNSSSSSSSSSRNNNGNDNNESLMVSNDEESVRIREKYSANNDASVDKRGAKSSSAEAQNVSLHVRFSEYNEYKTIGLTDTSIMSNDETNNLLNYCNDNGAWSDDRSTSPDSSDVEVLFSNIEIRNDTSSAIIEESSDILSNKRKERGSCRDEESIDRTTDDDDDDEDEDYTSYCSNEESCDEENTTITENRDETRKSSLGIDDGIVNAGNERETENFDDSTSTIGRDNENETTPPDMIVTMDVNDTIFKSELLKTRLAELEREIDIFRKENAALAVQREKLRDETRMLRRDYGLKEENLMKEKICNEETLNEEKKRLSREKAALESRLRDAREKSLRDKQERQEYRILRKQLDELRDETSQRESRWQAAQARQKSQIRVLQSENARLKQELEKAEASRASNLRNRKSYGFSNARSMHRISKQLDGRQRKLATRKDSSSDEEENNGETCAGETEIEKPRILDNDETSFVDLDDGKNIVGDGLARRSMIKNDDDLRKKRNMYVDLLNEATEGLRGNEEIIFGKNARSLDKLQREVVNEAQYGSLAIGSDSMDQRKLENSPEQCYADTTKNSPSPVTIEAVNMADNGETRRGINEDAVQESRRWSDVPICQKDRGNNSTIKQQEIRELTCPDGHLEYWYPNGNVKKIYPDRNVTKMIYYNGDVRETSEDGKIKYFYASTRTWHTTLPDGLEILEFPDGQVERRTKNGTNEVSFPDGSVRLLEADGTEKWILPDGTMAETFPDGNKILSFPNGQREVHTNEHKRREYPDGTVKLVYPDGTQETRYSNGRVRVKDKDGNLLVDVHHR